MLLAAASSASAQSATISASPATFNAQGDTINFSYVIAPGAYNITSINAATTAIKGVAVSCPPIDQGGTTSQITCTGSYQVDALDVMSGQFSDFVNFTGSRTGGSFNITTPTIVVRAASGGPVVLDVVASPTPSLPGEEVAVTATVSSMGCNAGQSPTGNVTITIGSVTQTLGLTPTGPVSPASSATLRTSALAVGQHAVSVSYGGGDGCSTGSKTGASHWVDTKPTVTINKAGSQADPSAKTSIQFAVAFDKAVTGFSGNDVQLSGTAGATTASVSGSGANYMVSVSGMTQAGTVIASIPAGKATSAAGFTNVDSTSTDNTVAYAPIVIAPATLPDPAYDQTYTSQTISATGGSGAITFSKTAGTLPTGMTLSSGGVLSGKPTTSGSFSFTVTATDAESSTAQKLFSFNIAAPTIVIAPSSLPDATFGTAYSQTIAASGGAGAHTLAVAQGPLPAGLTLTSGGLLSGTPTISGAFTFTVTATDAYGSTGSQVVSLNVAATVPDAPTIGTALEGDAQADVYFTAPAQNGGAAITTYTATSSPGGLTGTGSLSPITVAGLSNGTAYTFTVTATNSAGPSVSSAASNSVTPRSAQMITFANPGTQGFGTTPTLTASTTSGLTIAFSSSTPGVCDVDAGGLLTFHQAGTCTINADQPGNGTYLAATTVTQSFTVAAIAPDAPTGASATAGEAAAIVSFTAPASTGGALIASYTVTSDPAGITGTGATSPITVTGLTNGVSYTFTVTADNGIATGPASAVSNSVTPRGAQTITFANPGAQTFGSTPTLSATTSSGLPVSFTSSTAGVCSISPTGALTFHQSGTCAIHADQDGDGTYLPAATVSQSFTVNAIAADAPTGVSATAGDTQATVAFVAPASTGGSAITDYTVTSNPAGITATGASSPITVTGLANGTSYTFTVTANNIIGSGTDSAASNAVTPKAPQTIIFANPGPQGYAVPANLSASASSGLTPVFQTLTSTVCVVSPAGVVTFRNGGTCTIEVSQPGDSAYLAAANVSQSFVVSSPIFAFTPAAGTLPTATAATAYNQSFGASGGTAPYNFSIASGALPAGLTLDAASGTLSGTPTSDGTFNFSIQATDTYGAAGVSGYSLTVFVQAPIAAATSATVAANSSDNVIALNLAGGPAASVAVDTGPFHGAATATGTTIQYTPVSGYSGPDSFTYTATNASGTSAPATVTVTVSPPVLVFSPAGGALPSAVGGVSYNATISADAGTAPYSYAITSGALPAGLTLDSSSGAISGRPSGDGDFRFTVTATDANGAIGQASYQLAVSSGNFVFSPSGGALPDAMVGEDYSSSISATGGVGALVYSLKSGDLPKGMVLNVSTGEMTGPLATDATPDTYRFTIAVTDSRGASGSAAYTLTLNARSVTAPDVVVDVPAGETPKNVYLNDGATGGPFVSASVASVSPPIAGTAEVIEGELAAAGSFTPVGYYLKFIPNPSYSGSAVVSYTLHSALGSSNLGHVTYRIALDRVAAGEEIDGLVHDFIRQRQNLLSSTIKVPGLLNRRKAAASTDPVTTSVTPSEQGARLGFSSSLAQIQAARDAADAAAAGETFVMTDQPFDIWVNGSFLFHEDEDDKSDKWGNFALFSIGADYLVSDRALIGLSFHYDYMTDPTEEDAELKGNGWLAGPYASFEIGQGVFLEANLLYGGSSNDIDTGIFRGTFDTNRWMADVSVNGQLQLDEITMLTPKLRAVYFNEEVDDYTVRNSLGETIDLRGFIEEQARFSVGLDVERTLELENGLTLSPIVGADVGFASLDGEGLFGRVSAGLALSNNDNWDLDFSLLFNIEGDGSQAGGAKVGARVRF
ncbi:putative Ig domain-containing protein [Ensifer sp. MJa1]|uniref:putative Ig domain-containing protein n=1 Tax=Ensifer sp. MJa1 TaxID=2919888 RepID=UPI00300B84E5